MSQPRYIIVKYASYLYPQGVAPLTAAAHPDTFTARECGVTAEHYPSVEAAQTDLEKMRKFNPSVDYGIVKVS